MDADILKNFSDAINEIGSFLTDQSYGDELYYHSSCFDGTFFDTENYTAYLLYLKDHEAELFPMLRVMSMLTPYVAQHEKDALFMEKPMYDKLNICIQKFAFTFHLSFDPAHDMMADYISQKQAPAPATQPAVSFAPAPAMSTPAYTEAIDRQRLASYEQQIAQLKREKDELKAQNDDLAKKNDDLTAQKAKLEEQAEQQAQAEPEQDNDRLERLLAKGDACAKVKAELIMRLLEATGVHFFTDEEVYGTKLKKNTGARDRAAELIEFITSKEITKRTAKNHASDRDIPRTRHAQTLSDINDLLSEMGSNISL